MRRRDLNPGDVFVYLESPRFPGSEGMVHYVPGTREHEPAWCTGAKRSPRLGSWLHQQTLDARVLVIRPGIPDAG